jgi:hypothetical protein
MLNGKAFELQDKHRRFSMPYVKVRPRLELEVEIGALNVKDETPQAKPSVWASILPMYACLVQNREYSTNLAQIQTFDFNFDEFCEL